VLWEIYKNCLVGLSFCPKVLRVRATPPKQMNQFLGISSQLQIKYDPRMYMKKDNPFSNYFKRDNYKMGYAISFCDLTSSSRFREL